MATIATIVDLVTEVIQPAIKEPFELVDVEYGLYKAVEKQKVFEGNLVGFEEDVLTIEYMDKTRKKTVDIPYNLVSKARLAVKL